MPINNLRDKDVNICEMCKVQNYFAKRNEVYNVHVIRQETYIQAGSWRICK